MSRFRPQHEPFPADRSSSPSGGPSALGGPEPLPQSAAISQAGLSSPIGLEFLVQILSAELERRPDNRGALTSLSQCLGKLGRHEEGCLVNERLVCLMPEHPVAFYNLACSQALLGKEAEALRSLQQAVDFGFSDADYLEEDPDLTDLRDTPPFRALVHSLRKGTPRT